MKYLLNIFFLSFFLNNLFAQEKHFVFIQSDTKQPFYVSVNSKLYSSTASGYLIIPKLTDGSYSMTVGFAQNAYPEQTFNLAIQNKDLGFDLKNFNEKGWGLFNLQSLDITMASTANSNVVAKALNASSKAAPSVISFEKKKEVSEPPVKSGIDSGNANTTRVEEVKSATSKAEMSASANSEKNNTQTMATPDLQTKVVQTNGKAPQSSDVKKVSEVKEEEGLHLSYVEGSGKTKDTINVIIPSSPSSTNSTSASSASATDVNKTNAGTINHDHVENAPAKTKDDLKFLDLKMGSKKDTLQPSLPVTESRRIMENSNCKNIATDDDYAKLRKKMSGETTDEKMISEAKKFYRNKCFTTSQIKGLSTLFPSDEGRFKFFDASFVSVADASQYSTLQTEFVDPAFVARFKSLIQ